MWWCNFEKEGADVEDGVDQILGCEELHMSIPQDRTACPGELKYTHCSNDLGTEELSR